HSAAPFATRSLRDALPICPLAPRMCCGPTLQNAQRSGSGVLVTELVDVRDPVSVGVAGLDLVESTEDPVASPQHHGGQRGRGQRDRKSTRLNSSHVKNSYA